MRPLLWAALAGAVAGGAAAQSPCPALADAGAALQAGPVQGVWRAEPAPIVVGQPFALLLSLCPADAVLLRVAASMPEHRHGMNYRTSLQPLGGGRWRVEGLLWHMAGRWELRLDVQANGATHTARQTLDLP